MTNNMISLSTTIFLIQSVFSCALLIPPTAKTLVRPRQHETLLAMMEDDYKHFANDNGDSSSDGNGDEMGNDIPFFDDFGDMDYSSLSPSIPSFSSDKSSSSSSTATTDSLQLRIHEVMQQEQQMQSRIHENWQQGNWHVRGITLDLFSDVTYTEPLEETEEGEPAAEPDESSGTTNDEKDPRNFLPKNFLVPPPQVSSQPSTTRDQSVPIYIQTCVVSVDDEDADSVVVWMGRTDGSLVGVQYSEKEPWARFSTQLTPRLVQNKFTVKPSLVKDKNILDSILENEQDSNDNEEEGYEVGPTTESMEYHDEDEKFQLVAQVLEAPPLQQDPVQHILPIPQQHLVLSSTTHNGDIQAWLVPSAKQQTQIPQVDELEGVASPTPAFLVQAQMWTGVHTEPLVGLSWVSAVDLVCSVSQDGSLAFWDSSTACGLTAALYLLPPQNEDGISLTSAHASENYLMVGTSQGQVMIYTWQQILEQTAETTTEITAGQVSSNSDRRSTANLIHHLEPAGSLWMGNEGFAVTSIGSTVVDNSNNPRPGSPPEVTYIATGDSQGTVKQWQLFPAQDGTRVDTWPKMESQRVSGMAHLFAHAPAVIPENERDYASSDANAIVDLQYLQNGKVLLTASSDTVVCWNTDSGRKSHSLEGFDNLHNVCLLPQPRYSAFCTNGMKNVLCIHDYDMSLIENEEEDDDFDVSDYLNFDD
mmetsp:Transcript_12190/g.33830  ORF Transcript_12190/g.33830 Transcript_12190/m.33830 type:complete len:702 (-) Transcript_12190:226-2331(-)